MEQGVAVRVLSAALAAALAAAPAAAAPAKPRAEDALKVEIGVAPKPVAAGSEAEVTVLLSANPGFKLNKYPKVKLTVASVAGLVAGTETLIGSDSPPPPDRIEANYFKTVDPLKLKLSVTPSAPSGPHEVDAKLSFFYCVAASGFCAPGKLALKIPIVVR